MNSESRRRPWVVAGVAISLIAACSSDPSADPEATADPEPVVTSTTDVVVRASPPVSSDPAPEPTDLPPVETTFPLTGQPAPPGELLSRPALAVKIDNAPAARPQAGINQADVVFEERVEGGLTRFLAVFQSTDAADVGPVRSARSTDVPILATLGQPLFSWSGANAAFAALIEASNVVDVGVEAAFGVYTSREDERPPPSHLFSDTVSLYEAAAGRGSPPAAMFIYREEGEAPPADARPIAGVDLDFGATEVAFNWDDDLQGWVRLQNGTPHVDAAGQQIAPRNVVVRFAEYIDSGSTDANGVPVPEAVLQGQGLAWFLVDGMLIEGTWDQRALRAPVQYLTLAGTFARLAPGSTWIELPEEGTVTVR